MKQGELWSEDWVELERRFPAAYGWMLRRSLERELQHLEEAQQYGLPEGLARWLLELRAWRKEVSDIEKLNQKYLLEREQRYLEGLVHGITEVTRVQE